MGKIWNVVTSHRFLAGTMLIIGMDGISKTDWWASALAFLFFALNLAFAASEEGAKP